MGKEEFKVLNFFDYFGKSGECLKGKYINQKIWGCETPIECSTTVWGQNDEQQGTLDFVEKREKKIRRKMLDEIYVKGIEYNFDDD